jgi:hypothetical protein
MWATNKIVGLDTSISRRISKFTRNCGLAAVFFGLLGFAAQARADAVSDAVQNYFNDGAPVWFANYHTSDLAGFNPSSSTSLTINESPDGDIEDPTGNFDWGGSAQDVLQLHMTLSGGVPTSGSLLVTIDLSENPDYTGVDSTIFSSNTVRGFGQASGYDWFAFQNGSNPNDLIGGIIVDPGGSGISDVKLFDTSVPEPSSVAVLAAAGIVCGTGRFSRRFRRATA